MTFLSDLITHLVSDSLMSFPYLPIYHMKSVKDIDIPENVKETFWDIRRGMMQARGEHRAPGSEGARI